MAATSNQQQAAFLRPAAACSYLGMCRTQLHYISETDPTFPHKIRISSRCVGWTRKQLDTWLESLERGAA